MSLMLRLIKKLHGTGKIVVLYYGFCVMHGLVDIKYKGLYGVYIINNRNYWPRYIDEKKIKSHFTDNDVGAMDTLYGELRNVPLSVFATKEEDYVMMLMSTYGKNER